MREKTFKEKCKEAGVAYNAAINHRTKTNCSDEEAIEYSRGLKQKKIFKQKCLKANVKYVNAKYYKKTYNMSDEEAIEASLRGKKDKEKSFRQACLEAGISYDYAVNYRKSHNLSDEETIQYFLDKKSVKKSYKQKCKEPKEKTFKQKCEEAGAKYEQAIDYRRRHKLDDETAIKYALNGGVPKEKSFRQRCLKEGSLREVEELPAATKGSEPKPSNLPEYMRFLVFTPDRDSINQSRKITGANGEEQIFKGLLDETASYFRSAFGRYGYTIRTTIISSTSNEERNNVNLIDYSEGIGRKEIPEDKLDKVVKNQPMVIDLIFSINMLNVGYHVNDITGLVLRRWTGSNTIYFQQMGRCLSVDSPNIPVVFDFVNDISNKGISMPLYSFDKQKKAETINADGTKDINYKDLKRKHQRGNCLINGYNPKWNNAIDAKQVIISTESATIEEIHSRLDTYTRRKFSSKLLETAYEAYRKLYSYHRTDKGIYLDNYLDSPKFLYEIYNSTIKTLDKRASVDTKQMSVNYKAFYEYIKDRAVTQDKPCEVFIDFSKLVAYFGNKKLDKLAAVDKKSATVLKKINSDTKSLSKLVEINTLLAISKTVNNPNGAIVRLIVSDSDKQRKLINQALQMKNDWIDPKLEQLNYIYDEVNNFFKTYGITPANIIYYRSEPVEKAE